MKYYKGVAPQSPQQRNQRSKTCFLQMIGTFIAFAIIGLIIDLMVFHSRNERFVYRVSNKNDNNPDYISADLHYFGPLDTYLNNNNSIIQKLRLNITKDSNQDLTIRIIDAEHERFEVEDLNSPDNFGYNPAIQSGWGDLEITIEDENNNFNLKIIRKSTRKEIFNFGDIEFIFSNRYIQFGTVLSTEHLWGLGERVSKNFSYEDGTYTIWNRHQSPGVVDNGSLGNQGSGFHPVYLRKEQGSGWHVVFIQTSNGLAFTYNKKSSLLFRLTGGIVNLKIFTGDSPASVIERYHRFLGSYIVPPFWATGYHQSKFGFNNSQAIIDVWKNFSEYQLPLDAIWSDHDYTNSGDTFTIDTVRFNISDMKKEMLNQSENYIRWVPSITIAINKKQKLFSTYQTNNLLIKSVNFASDLVGCGENGLVVYPDYNKLETMSQTVDNVEAMFKIIEFQGVWLDGSDMYNLVSGELPQKSKTCNGSIENNGVYDNMPYNILNTTKLSSSTISTNAIYYYGDSATVVRKSGGENLTDFNFHNLNAFAAMKAMAEAMPRGALIMTKSTTFGTGYYGGHFIQDNLSTFQQMRYSLISILNFQIFGIPFTGAAICGGSGARAGPELCARWMALGSMYPFAMNYNGGGGSQEPYSYTNDSYVLEASRRSLQLRYSLLKYYYTEYARNLGIGTVFNPLFIYFPDDQECLSNDREAMIGPALLITPVLEPANTQNFTRISPYFPDGAWYSLVNKNLKFIGGKSLPFNVKFEEPCPTFLREGYLVVYQDIVLPDKNITRTRQLDHKIRLAIALVEDKDQKKQKQQDIMFFAHGSILSLNNYNNFTEVCTDERKNLDCVTDINCSGVLTDSKNLALNITFEKGSYPVEINWLLKGIDIYSRNFQTVSVDTDITINKANLTHTIHVNLTKDTSFQRIQ